MRTKLLACGMALFAGMTVVPRAQAQAPQPGGPGTGPVLQPGDVRTRISVRTDLVIVPVTVKDDAGHLVGDLTQDEFRVFADNIEQQVLLFTSDPYPLSAVVLIDNDLSQKSAAQVQKSLEAISAGFGPNDEVALLMYEENPTTVEDFSFNNDQLFTELKRLDLGSHSTAVNNDPTNTLGPIINGGTGPQASGCTPPGCSPSGIQLGLPQHGAGRPADNNALDDAIYAAGAMLRERPRNRRKIIFLISDGSNGGKNRHTYEETLHELLEGDISVYAIYPEHEVPLGRKLLERGAAELQKYTDKTGGDMFYAAKQGDLERLYADVTEQARNEYTLAFSPHGASTASDFHPIEVRVRRPGLNILAREGYYRSAISVGH